MPIPDFDLHRRRLIDALPADEAVLLFGAREQVRNGDSEHRYRPDSDVYWLTGWEDPECAVFVRGGEEPVTMFVQPRDREREVWTGRRPGVEGARRKHGADVAYVIAELERQLPRLLHGVRAVHHAFARDADHDAVLMSSVTSAARSARKTGLTAPETFHHLSQLVHELRLRKTEDEIAVLRAAAELTAEGHLAAMRKARAGVYEYEIEAELLGRWRRRGSTGPGYTPIVATGVNGTVLHYHANRDELREGDLLLLDAGCEMSYYTADVTRTFPVSGRFTPEQRAVYEHVLRAQLLAIDACRAGRTFDEVHDAARRALTEGMIDLGLLKGPVEDRIRDESFLRYYMHGTSHWLGLDVHDVGAYGRGGVTRTLEAGMVLTVEPGLYIDPDDDEAPAHLRGIGVRIEDDVLVTDGDPDVLSDIAPKTVDEVEAACA
ncbi:MAG: aminopeptidase P N-terminal domain-containing protein [Alphaproteobacteria bacterium]|nr:aminopeptidase P N-terminal domain-containing protein [Alphaproteobacteria bacterium]